MRLDKFLKNARIIKRRTLAKQVAEQGRIKLNGNVAKASTVVGVGDELEIQFGQKILGVKVNAIRDIVKKEEAETLYTVVREERIEQEK
ncbi:RNA-binding S4 domain-containing protein [Ornithinibacillus sp. 4-3]|uniref:RQC P-site tRNA stabilizing factor n=1 Tax=Ornithinibacillus sp. 4-3 TaxID=3231488 RepID=A0AB39HL61_9BACI